LELIISLTVKSAPNFLTTLLKGKSVKPAKGAKIYSGLEKSKTLFKF